MAIPEVVLSSTSPATGARAIPVLGMGTGNVHFTPEQGPATKHAILRAIELGYRHFDTAAIFRADEDVLAEAIAEALQAGFIHSRAELFITSKIWCTDAHRDLVVPAIRESLRNLKLDYLDLYLIHWPLRLKAGESYPPIESHHILPFDLKSVWEGMEECQRLGLAKHIGVSNFTTWKLAELLQYAKVPPAAVQVEMNPTWQQKKLREFCKEKGVHVIAYSPLGGHPMFMGKNLVLESQVLKDIAKARGKTLAQVSLRWIYEQGASMVVKTIKKERVEENMKIFDWELSEEDKHKISQLPQCKRVTLRLMLSAEAASKLADEDEVVEEYRSWRY